MTAAQLLELAVTAALDGATVVAANERTARLVRAECERRHASGTVWHTPSVLSWGAWISQLWNAAVIHGHVSQVVLNSSQQLALWTEIISSAEATANAVSLAPLALEAWQLAHEYEIDIGAGPLPTPETRAFARWASRYRDTCAANSWTDHAACVSTLTACAERLRPHLPRKIVVVGFDVRTPQQDAFLRAISAQQTEVEICEPASQAADSRPTAFDDPACEIMAAAQWARHLLEADPAARIGIVVPKLGEQRGLVEHAFRTAINPESLHIDHLRSPLAFDVSLGTSLAEYPVIRTALNALRLAAGALSATDVGALLRSPFLGESASERSARAVFDLALRQSRKTEFTAGDLVALATRDAKCPSLLARFTAFSALARNLAAQRPSQWNTIFNSLLDALGWPGAPLASDEFQTHEKWSGVLREFASLDLVTRDTLTCDAAIAELSRIAERQTFRPENAGAPVQIMGPLEAAGSSFDHLWVLGLTDEDWPSRGRANPMLPLSVQRAHNLPHSSAEADALFATRATARLAASARDVIFSFPRRADDRELRPSPLLIGLPFVYSDELCLTPARAWYAPETASACESLVDEAAPPAEAGLVRRGGTKLIQLQSACPFRAFAEFRLAAARLEDARSGLDPRDRGRLVEHVLQYIWDELRDSHGLQANRREPELAPIIERAIDKAFAAVLPAPVSLFDQRFRALERERLGKLAREWLTIEAARGEQFTVEAHQLTIEIALGALRVTGRIDRLDHLSDGTFVIVDYKTGSDSFTPGSWAGPRPREPQLPMYAVAHRPEQVGAVAFGMVRTGECRLNGVAIRDQILPPKRNGKPVDLATEIAKWREMLEKIAGDYLAGHAAADPLREACDYCHLKALCRIDSAGSEQEDADAE